MNEATAHVQQQQTNAFGGLVPPNRGEGKTVFDPVP